MLRERHARGLITLEANNAEARNVLSRSQANGSQVAQLEAALQMLGLVHQNPVSITQTVSSAGRVSSNLAARQSPNAASVARGSSCVTTSALPDRSRTADFHRTSCGRDARGHRCSLHRSPGELRSCYLVTHAQQAMVPVPRMLRISATNVLVIGEVVQLERFVSPSGTPALYGARGSHRNEERLARAGGTAPRARRPESGGRATRVAPIRFSLRLPSPSAIETRTFIERHQASFAGSGVGWADAQIIVAALKAGARLHSTDRAVRKVCRSVAIVLA